MQKNNKNGATRVPFIITFWRKSIIEKCIWYLRCYAVNSEPPQFGAGDQFLIRTIVHRHSGQSLLGRDFGRFIKYTNQNGGETILYFDAVIAPINVVGRRTDGIANNALYVIVFCLSMLKIVFQYHFLAGVSSMVTLYTAK